MKYIYLIQYKLASNPLLDSRIKGLGSWLKYFDNNWIVETNLSARDIYNILVVGHEKDSIFIIELSKSNYFGRMDTKVWDYFKERKQK